MTAAPTKFPHLTDTAGMDTLLPDEDPAVFKAFRDGLLEEFAPKTAYQSSLAMNLVSIEWDIARHRRLIAAVLREAFRRQAGGVEKHGTPGAVSHLVTLDVELDFGRDILNQSRRTIPVLAKSGVTLSEITAAALSSRLDTVAYHEGRISDLERRRRTLRDDYERLQSRKRPAEDVEDAVEVL
jgi:hypothetical protein